MSTMRTPFSLFVVLIAVVTAARGSIIRSTVNGPVEGKVEDNVAVFHDVPFASPPTGALRFQSAKPLTKNVGNLQFRTRWSIIVISALLTLCFSCNDANDTQTWEKPLDCKIWRKSCVQLHIAGPFELGSEDCLYLNVFAPANATLDPPSLPVMFFIHGGGFIIGSAYQGGFYDGKRLATERNVIVVSANYRLGPFGFLATRELQEEDKDRMAGNAGLTDQRMAMQWIQDNIHNFGGDKELVTVFGQSAGGFSVCAHLASPASDGLFSRAIMESGSCDSSDFFPTLSDAISFGLEYAKAVGCEGASTDCLRSLKPHDLLLPISSWLHPDWPNTTSSATENLIYSPELSKRMRDSNEFPLFASRAHRVDMGANQPLGIASWMQPLVEKFTQMFQGFTPILAPVMPFGPAIDGSDVGLLQRPIDSFRSGHAARVPTIFGSNKDEGTFFVALAPLWIHKGFFPEMNNADVNMLLTKILGPQHVAAVEAAYPLSAFKDENQRVARIIRDWFFECGTRRSAIALSHVHPNVYRYQFSYKLHWVEEDLGLGDYHTSELFFVFGNQWPALLHHFNKNDWEMSRIMQAYWGNLAWNGDPNLGESVPTAWPRTNNTADLLLFDLPSPHVEDGVANSHCDLWDSLPI